MQLSETAKKERLWLEFNTFPRRKTRIFPNCSLEYRCKSDIQLLKLNITWNYANSPLRTTLKNINYYQISKVVSLLPWHEPGLVAKPRDIVDVWGHTRRVSLETDSVRNSNRLNLVFNETQCFFLPKTGSGYSYQALILFPETFAAW